MQRDHSIDVAKGLAMIFVMIGHCSFTSVPIRVWIYSFHMPLFFVLSGMVFSNRKYPTFKSFFISKFRSLAVPYFLMNILLWIYRMFFSFAKLYIREREFASLDWKGLIGIGVGYRLTDYYNSLWFLSVLFLAELAFYLIEKYITKGRNIPIIILTTVTFVGGFFVAVNLHGFVWSADLMLLVISFLSIGYLIKINKEKTEKLFKPLFMPFLLTASIAAAYFNYQKCGRPDMHDSNFGNIFLYAAGIITSVWLVIIVSRLIGQSRPVEYIGRNTLSYYFAHDSFIMPWFVFGFKKVLGVIGMEENIFAKFAVMVVIVTVVAFICAFVSGVINRIFPQLVGKKKKLDLNLSEKMHS